MTIVEEFQEYLEENEIDTKEIYEELGITQASYYTAISQAKKGTTHLWIKAFMLGVKKHRENY